MKIESILMLISALVSATSGLICIYYDLYTLGLLSILIALKCYEIGKECSEENLK